MLPTRLRKNSAIRSLVRENKIEINDIIYPLFIKEGLGGKEEIQSMKGQYRLGLNALKDEINQLKELGIKAVLLFGIPSEKDGLGTSAYVKNGIVQKAIKEIKEVAPDMYVITDVCLCEYKEDGQCCFFFEDARIDRKKTLETLAKIALSHAAAGADMVAPSDMMDEHINEIREELDKNGFEHIPIMGYSAKYNSSFYGPFRDAADSAPKHGDRKAYQMDPANSREALKEIQCDLEEGVDLIMVKPAMSYLDIINKARDITELPVAAYQVSGEYSMLKQAVDSDILSESVLYETLLSIKRAGADLIITYFAKDIPNLLNKYQD